MPRLTPENRDARRADIVAAARRCFSRDGFHQTSMPDIAVEAGVSTGAPYRYFASKEEIILEIAGDAFRVIFEPVEALVQKHAVVSLGDLITTSVEPVRSAIVTDAAGNPVPSDELLRCAVQAWGELLRHDGLREAANVGFERVRGRMAQALRNGQEAEVVAADLDVDRVTRVVMALLHGFVLQRVAFGLDDIEGFTKDVRAVLADVGVSALTPIPTLTLTLRSDRDRAVGEG